MGNIATGDFLSNENSENKKRNNNVNPTVAA